MASKRIIYYDLLNIVACFCVICLHCNTMVHQYQPGLNWACGLVIEVVCYWAVPVFFMLSGATLMRYRDRYDTKTFFKRRLMRVLVPFIAWSLIIYLIRFGIFNHSASFGPREFLDLFFSNGIEGVYWFFFPMISLYLAMPVLSALADNKRVLGYLVVMSFALQSLIPPLFQLAGIPWSTSLNLPVAAGYVFFAALGYLAATTDIENRHRMVIYALGIACLVLRYAYTLCFSSVETNVDRFFFSYTQFTAVLPALAVFIWFRYHDWGKRPPRLERHAKAIASISSCSFGIYLIHMLVISNVAFGFLEIPTTSIAMRTIGPFVVYAVCLVIVLIGKRIPVVNRLFP